MSLRDGYALLMAIRQLGEEWPRLLGARFADFEKRINPALEALQDEPGSRERQHAVRMILDDFPEVRDRVDEALRSGEVMVPMAGPPPEPQMADAEPTMADLPEPPAPAAPMPPPAAPMPPAPAPTAPPPAMAKPGGWLPDVFSGGGEKQKPEAKSVTVWYGTDRKNTKRDDPAERYSGERGDLQFGRLEVSIPHDHRMGELEKPKWWKFEFRKNPQKHVVLMKVEERDVSAWKAEVRQSMEKAGTRDALLFIHGYNVSFEDAARRAAQFAYDLEFRGVPVLYSWPSEATTLRYTVDEGNAHWTVTNFVRFLRVLMEETGAEVVHAVAHSMGNRVLTEGLRRLHASPPAPGAARLREIVFAAPDIDADTFRDFVKDFQGGAERMTLYASDSDKALEASQKLHRYPRAGDAGDGIVISTGLDSIDASAVDTSFMGHSYFGDNRSVISDLYSLLRDGKSPDQRFGMRERASATGRYWAFLP